MTTVMVKPWSDPVLDVLGHDPRSWYVETFWLPTLGPTCVLLMRHLADRFDRTPDGLALDVTTTSECLGLGTRDGTSSPLRRSLARLEQFDLAVSEPEAVVRVRRNLPPVNRRHVKRLPVGAAGASRRLGHRRAHRRSRSTSHAGTRATCRDHADRTGRRGRPRRARARLGRVPSLGVPRVRASGRGTNSTTNRRTAPTAAPPLDGR